MPAKITEISGMDLRILRVLWDNYLKCRLGEEYILYLSWLKVAELLGMKRETNTDPSALMKKLWSYNTYFNELTQRGYIECSQYKISKDIQNKINRIGDGFTDRKFMTEDEKQIEKYLEEQPNITEISIPLVKLTLKGIEYCEKIFNHE